jgi:competence protein ComEC
MLHLAAAFAGGVLALQFCAVLPSGRAYLFIPVVFCLLPWRTARPVVKTVLVFLLGLFWAAWQAQPALHAVLPAGLEGRTLLVEGRVLERPLSVSERQQRFLFHVDRLNSGDTGEVFQGKVRLSLYGKVPSVAEGERWQLAVRLKRPHGFLNPGGFDYERWLYQQGIRATGYIRHEHEANRLIAEASVPVIDRFRSRLITHLESQPDAGPARGIIRALTVGDRDGLGDQQWDVFRDTGTSHLIAISGLHISLVAGLVFWISRFLWSCCGVLVERYPARKVAAVAAIIAAIVYALLAGFGIPARRAVVMVTVFMLAIVADRDTSFARTIALAAIVVLLLDPVSILSPGWWLSFWAVISIAYCITARYGTRSFAEKWIYMHVVLALAMFPLLVLFFQQASVIAPIANMIAVPFVAMLVVPVALAGTLLFSVSVAVGDWLLRLAATLMELLWPLLHTLAEVEQGLWHPPHPAGWTLVPALLGIAILFMPRGVPGRWLALWLMLPALLVEPQRPAWGEVKVTVLDVGQGLSVVARTQQHTLVFDTGPRFSRSFDTGSAVVVPFLRHSGVRRLDMLVVSHGDNDHIGGAASLLDEFPANTVLSSVPELLPAGKARGCNREQRWVWEGVRFEMLHPGDEYLRGNDASCVMRIVSAGGQGLLLTGDIEAPAEQQLLAREGESLRARILVAPHHGSNTSSTPAFISAVSPDIVLFPSGYRNRYGFPKTAVVQRYNGVQAKMYETGLSGALTITLSSGNEEPVIRRFRDVHRRYWQSQNIP